MATNSTDGLWTLGFGKVGATFKGMQDAGITPELLARFRSNKAADKQWAKEMAQIMLGNDQISATIPATVEAAHLELRRTTNGSARESFKATDFFKDKGRPDGVRFWLADNFKTYFLKGVCKVELNVPTAKLNAYRLREASVEGSIIVALGGNDSAKTSLAYMAQLIKAQAKGQEGVLLTNGWANIFYVEDNNGKLRSVDCRWYSGGGQWEVRTRPVTRLGGWFAGYQVFSPAVLTS